MNTGNKILLEISNANENNLKDISISLPHNRIIAVTGVSGSGKSSLVFDVIYAESRFRYLSDLSGQSRQFFSKLSRPSVGSIKGLRPSIAVDQRTVTSGPRSTVGTISEIYDYLRLLFARLGSTSIEGVNINRSLFSFNTPAGACRSCKGIGLTDFIDPNLLISDENRSLRQGALVITTPSGYIIYSQVTMDVLDQVCNSEGFNVDIPWKDLTDEQKHIVLYGSDKIKIPFGKHTLESRMKWKGITAKPREEGYYKGILPIMEDILKRDRNDNILRFARTACCPDCKGTRLSKEALSVKWNEKTISEFADMTISEADDFFRHYSTSGNENEILDEISDQILRRTDLLIKLGLGYLTISRDAASLSGGESQRLRLVNQAVSSLQGLIYVLDEPTAGLHPSDSMKLMQVLADLCDKGNTVIIVEHDRNIISNADWIVDIGPGAGYKGGELLFSGTFNEFLETSLPASPTWRMMKEKIRPGQLKIKSDKQPVVFRSLIKNNLKDVNATILTGALNVISGVSGAGKSSFAEAIEEKINSDKKSYPFGKVISIDQKPIGRTPRSNPATYTGMFDHVRKLFGGLPSSSEKGLKHSDFSFNTGNGRCPKCEGAGYMQIGMHFMGNVEVVCELCHGKRFVPNVLEVKYRNKSIADILDMRISEALVFFDDVAVIKKYLEIMTGLGLDYLFLGQTSTTLSGGEAQRIKLAAELASPSGKNCLYLFDEPTTGMHNADVSLLLEAFCKLCENGHTILCIEHHELMISAAVNVIDVGPGSGECGGRVLYNGDPEGMKNSAESVTAKFLSADFSEKVKRKVSVSSNIVFSDVNTNNLKNISFSLPHAKTTIVTGVSGSGKTSLAFDTVFAESYRRYTGNWSSYIRSHLPQLPAGDFLSCSGITPAFSVRQDPLSDNPRSTVGTYTGIYDLFRLLYSRVAFENNGGHLVYSTIFSFNHQDGACTKCNGLGEIKTADPEKLVTDPGRSVLEGALDGTKTGKFYGDPKGQYVAAMIAVGKESGIDFNVPYDQLNQKERDVLMYGTGETRYNIEWNYSRGEREGVFGFEKNWPGLVALVDEEYSRKHADKRGDAMLPIMKTISCPECNGSRLRKDSLQYKVAGIDISDLSMMEINECLEWFDRNKGHKDLFNFTELLRTVTARLTSIASLSLGYLPVNRSTGSLSGGERQRLKLANLLNSSFTGISFILDEPASGLHPSDREEIGSRLEHLKKNGNTLIIVEHQKDLFGLADNIIEMGPGAGREGGLITFSGPPGDYLKSRLPEKIEYPEILVGNEFLQIKNATERNLKGFDITIPLNSVTSITGVSGAGKTTLLRDVIFRSVSENRNSGCREFLLNVNISPVYCSPGSSGRKGSGSVMTYSGISDPLRKLFAAQPGAKDSGITHSHFSANTSGGRCEACKGLGYTSVSMDFLPDVEIPCSVCEGKKFIPEVLGIKVDGKNINDFMEMTVKESSALMEKIQGREAKAIKSLSETLIKTGLGHLTLGQRLSDISGGEWQRLQMAVALMSEKHGQVLFLLDEPGGGLSESDINLLGNMFADLVKAGHTVVFTEHRPELIRYSGWNIDLGTGGGKKGGKLIYCGITTGLKNCNESITANYL